MSDLEGASSRQWVICITLGVMPLLMDTFMNISGLSVKITLDTIEEMKDVSQAKETMRSSWTNLGLIAALLLTVIFAMLQADLPDDADKDWVHVYVSLCGASSIVCLLTTVEAIILLLYTDPLSTSDVLRFVISYPGSVGGPLTKVYTAVIYMLVAINVWVLLAYSDAAFVGCLIPTVWAVLFSTINPIHKSKFSGQRTHRGSERWKWAEEDGPCPRKLKNALIGTLKKTAKKAKELEEKEALQGAPETMQQEDTEAKLTPSMAPTILKSIEPAKPTTSIET